MPITLSPTLQSTYLAQTLASARASAIVAAVPTAAPVRIFDGSGTQRAAGTLVAPWAVASGATITVGEVSGAGIVVTDGGTPDANWWVRIGDATNHVRGSFGLPGSGRDFIWNSANGLFQTTDPGNPATIGTVGSVTFQAFAAAGGGGSAPVNTVAPSLTGTAEVGQLFTLNDGTWTGTVSSTERKVQRSDNGTTGWSDIPDTNATAYLQASGDEAKYLRPAVRKTGPGGATSDWAYGAARGPIAAAGAEGLLTQSNLEYVGAFRVPRQSGTAQVGEGHGLAYRGVSVQRPNGSLFVGSRGNRVAEIAIPTPVNTTTFAALPQATILNPGANVALPEVSEGTMTTANIGGGESANLNGLLAYNGNLIFSALAVYSNSGQNKSHWKKTGLDITAVGGVTGPHEIVTAYGIDSSRWHGGGMCYVPSNWQSALGAPVLTGNTGGSIVSSLSRGPTLTAFDPDHLGVMTVNGTVVLGYPNGNELNTAGDAADGVSSEIWNQTSRARHMVWPNGTRSVLFFGRHGTGPYYYGSLLGVTGNHAPPYRYQVWAFDASDLARVKNGEIALNAVQPYAYWGFTIPMFQHTTATGAQVDIAGACIQPASESPSGKQRIYIAAAGQETQESSNLPVIHVFDVNL